MNVESCLEFHPIVPGQEGQPGFCFGFLTCLFLLALLGETSICRGTRLQTPGQVTSQRGWPSKPSSDCNFLSWRVCVPAHNSV